MYDIYVTSLSHISNTCFTELHISISRKLKRYFVIKINLLEMRDISFSSLDKCPNTCKYKFILY